MPALATSWPKSMDDVLTSHNIEPPKFERNGSEDWLASYFTAVNELLFVISDNFSILMVSKTNCQLSKCTESFSCTGKKVTK